jgi:Cysteine-rich secretory protein family
VNAGDDFDPSYFGDCAAENIAAGTKTWAETFHMWQTSPGHNANLLRSKADIVGVAGPSCPKRRTKRPAFGRFSVRSGSYGKRAAAWSATARHAVLGARIADVISAIVVAKSLARDSAVYFFGTARPMRATAHRTDDLFLAKAE